MKALQLLESRRLAVCDVAEPAAPAPDEAIVRVEFVALNHLDLYGYRGMAFAKRRLPMTVGVEGAGVVESVGAHRSDLRVGERVAIYPGDPCGACRACRSGVGNRCQEPMSIMGFHYDGMAAERVRVKRRQLIRLPADVRMEHAACTPVTMATVQHMLFDNARLEAGETVLVHAGGSGIGSIAILAAKAAGATVITTVGSDWKAEKARALGADHVINYTRQPFHSMARRLTHKRGVDVVFEHVGEMTWEGSLLSLAKGGRLVTCGSTTGPRGATNLLHLVNQQIKIFASFGGTVANVQESVAKLEARTIEPPIDRVVDVAGMADTLADMEQRSIFGKVLLRGFAAASVA